MEKVPFQSSLGDVSEWKGKENKEKYDANSICVLYVCSARKVEKKNMMKDCSRMYSCHQSRLW